MTMVIGCQKKIKHKYIYILGGAASLFYMFRRERRWREGLGAKRTVNMNIYIYIYWEVLSLSTFFIKRKTYMCLERRGHTQNAKIKWFLQYTCYAITHAF
mmetsp:Transcript_31744/g.46680  ORF Transcript_31744/g.46680 Transcript_31744/m.46680 type:complete len:100 (+) Transcript_31744:313-612(+)